MDTIRPLIKRTFKDIIAERDRIDRECERSRDRVDLQTERWMAGEAMYFDRTQVAHATRIAYKTLRGRGESVQDARDAILCAKALVWWSAYDAADWFPRRKEIGSFWMDPLIDEWFERAKDKPDEWIDRILHLSEEVLHEIGLPREMAKERCRPVARGE